MQVSGTGIVLPAGSSPAVSSLPSGKVSVLVKSWVGENEGKKDSAGNPAISWRSDVILVYPDGFSRVYQIKDAQDIAARAIGQLRGHYGVKGNINILKLPEKPGDTLEMEIEDGKQS